MGMEDIVQDTFLSLHNSRFYYAYEGRAYGKSIPAIPGWDFKNIDPFFRFSVRSVPGQEGEVCGVDISDIYYAARQSVFGIHVENFNSGAVNLEPILKIILHSKLLF